MAAAVPAFADSPFQTLLRGLTAEFERLERRNDELGSENARLRSRLPKASRALPTERSKCGTRDARDEGPVAQQPPARESMQTGRLAHTPEARGDATSVGSRGRFCASPGTAMRLAAAPRECPASWLAEDASGALAAKAGGAAGERNIQSCPVAVAVVARVFDVDLQASGVAEPTTQLISLELAGQHYKVSLQTQSLRVAPVPVPPKSTKDSSRRRCASAVGARACPQPQQHEHPKEQPCTDDIANAEAALPASSSRGCPLQLLAAGRDGTDACHNSGCSFESVLMVEQLSADASSSTDADDASTFSLPSAGASSYAGVVVDAAEFRLRAAIDDSDAGVAASVAKLGSVDGPHGSTSTASHGALLKDSSPARPEVGGASLLEGATPPQAASELRRPGSGERIRDIAMAWGSLARGPLRRRPAPAVADDTQLWV
mmetsp:Transcript_90731/g.261441  ORF Transcript_90731/g.261441 Transcript_90731/m.261441 type:complete len:433 (+) Transcript_90731:41-1339(+)|eukprot:CAMPEP_0176050034 /NCGR_PEP_ID=MMETSP0120_2-20121206/24866_1 /TAXON_ID=160619 /ORGANISM="Kryptoperidinium foliaceum, Strain CCMP 1326" /LENGTH=432 /DNA_ID=CAMNT_0017383465 /DNA_START=40 /DNA_END=1338 /DNA_ORIENTATION=+